MPTLKFDTEIDYTGVLALRDRIKELQDRISANRNNKLFDLDEANTQLKQMQSELTAMLSAAAQNGSAFEKSIVEPLQKANENVQTLTDALILQRKALDDNLRKQQEIVAAQTAKHGENISAWDAEAVAQLDAAQDEERGLRDAMVSTNDAMLEQKEKVALLTDEYKKAKPPVDDFTKATKSLKSFLLQGAAFAGVATSLKSFVGQIIDTRRKFQMMEQSMKVLLGSEEKAADLMGKIRDYASTSPLDLSSVTSAAQQMLSFNIEAEKVPKFIKAIGDVSMGSTSKFRGLTLAFSQMSATGRLMGQDLLQMVNAGFNPLTEMSRKTGKSIKQLKDEMQKGAISAEMVQDAFISATSAGGKFAGMAEAASKTIEGQFSMLKDAVDSMFNTLGEQSEGIITGSLEVLTNIIKHWKEIGKVIANVVAVYGEYRAVLMVVTTIQRAQRAAGIAHVNVLKALYAQIVKNTGAMRVFNAVCKANPYVLLGTVIAGVITSVSLFSDKLDTTKTAQDRLNKSIDEFNKKEENRQTAIQKSMGVLNDETATILQQVQAYNELLAQSPALKEHYKTMAELQNASADEIQRILNEEKDTNQAKMLDQEEAASKARLEELKAQQKGRVMGAASAFGSTASIEQGKQVALMREIEIEEAKLLAIQEKRKAFDEDKKKAEYEALSNSQKLSIKRTELAQKEEEQHAALEQKKMAEEAVYQELLKSNPKLAEDYKNAVNSTDADALKNLQSNIVAEQYSNMELTRVLTAADSAATKVKAVTDEVGELTSAVSALEDAAEKKGEVSYAEAMKKLRTEYENAEKAWVRAQANKNSLTKKEYEDAQQKYTAAKESYTKAGGKVGKDSTWKDIKDSEKALAEERKKQAEEQAKNEKEQARKEWEFQHALKETQINALADGYEKINALRELQNEKELHDLQVKYEDEEQAITDGEKALLDKMKSNWDKEQDLRQKKQDAYAKSKGIESRDVKKAFDVTSEEFLNSEDGKLYQAQMAQFATQRKILSSKQDTEIAALKQNDAQEKRDDLNSLQDYYSKYLDIEKQFAEERKEIEVRLAQGDITEEQAAALRKATAIQRDAQMKQEGYTPEVMQQQFQDFADVANAMASENLGVVQSMLEQYMAQLEAAQEAGDDNGVQRALVAVKELSARLKDLKNDTPKDLVQAWNKYGTAVRGAVANVKNLGQTMDDELGRILEDISEVSESVMSMFDNITQLAQGQIEAATNLTKTSIEGMNAASEGGAKAMSAVEKASVILAIIGAALQIIQKITAAIGTTDDKYKAANEKQQQINRMTEAVNDYELAVMKAQNAEKKWFASSGIGSLRDNWDEGQKALDNYYAKVNEQQVKYQNEKGRGLMGALLNPLGQFDAGLTNLKQVREATKYTKEYVSAIDNLRIETRSKKKGVLGIGAKDQKTMDLRTYVKENMGVDLFDKDNMIDVEAAKQVIEKQGDKLVGETKATLEKLIENKEAYDEAMKAIEEHVSQMYAPITDNMTDALMNWLDTGEDVMDTFADYAGDTFRNIAQDMVKQLVLDNVMGDYEEKMKKLYQSYSAKEIDQDELVRLSAQYTNEVKDRFAEQKEGLQDMVQTISDTYKQVGIDISNAQQDEQQATFGGYETMSEQTGTELSGRFSAMYMVQSRMLEIAATDSLAFENIKNITAAINSAVQSRLQQADETQYILTQSLLELQAINANTALQPKVLKNLNEKIDLWNEHILNL